MKKRTREASQPMLIPGQVASLPEPGRRPLPSCVEANLRSIAADSGLSPETFDRIVRLLLDIAAARPVPKRRSWSTIVAEKGEDWVRDNMDVLAMHPWPPPLGDHPHVSAIRAAVAADALDRAALELLRVWDKSPNAMKERDVLRAAATIGGDGFDLELAQRVERWPGKDNRRAVLALQSLWATERTLARYLVQALSTLPTRLQVPVIARALIEREAKRLAISPDALCDQFVPVFGLDNAGAWTFRVGFEELHLHLDGNLRSSLRRANGSEVDPELAAKARSARGVAWPSLHAMLEAAHGEASRLENAMLAQRRWPIDPWRRTFVEHPVLAVLARGVIWACWQDGLLISTFRVHDDGGTSDVAGKSVELTGEIGIPHPRVVDLRPWQRSVLAGDLFQPFEQVRRRHFSLSEAERAAPDLHWWCDQHADAKDFTSLPARWTPRTHYPDSGKVTGFVLTISGRRVFEVRIEPGFEFVRRAGAAAQRVVAMLLLDVHRDDSGWRRDEPVPLREAPPLAISEALRDLAAVLGEPRKTCAGAHSHRSAASRGTSRA